MKNILKYLKPFIPIILIIILLVFVESVADLLLPTLTAGIIDTGIRNADFGFILRTGGIMLLITLFGVICNIISAYLASKVSVKVGANLRKKMFYHVENFTLNEVDQIGTSSLITRLTNDIIQVQNIVFMMLRMMLMAPLMCVGGIFMAVTTDLQLSVVLLFILPLLLILVAITAKMVMPLFSNIQKKVDQMNLVIREKLNGIRVIRAFNKTQYEEVRFDKENNDLKIVSIKVQKIMSTMIPLVMLLMNLTTIAIVWFGSFRVSAGAMEVGNITAFIQYATLILMSMMIFAMIFIMLPRAITSAERINQVLDTQISITDNGKHCQPLNNEIDFQGVSSRYVGAENLAVENISFIASSGKTTAIIGGTGSGKSTLLNLIMRFYDVEDGRILIGGCDIKDIDQKELRAKIGYIPQKAVLFSGTIRDNMKFGKEDATDEQIIEALTIAQAKNFVFEKPEGLDAEVAQGGTNFSGGQKQRLSIARALIRKPEIYLFDDSFSALDFKTDAVLREALKPAMQNATTIIVAQRVSTIMNADRILMMDDGEIVGDGTHRELLKTCEPYREIAFSQLSEEELA